MPYAGGAATIGPRAVTTSREEHPVPFPADRHASTDKLDRAERTEPTLAAEQIEKTLPTEATEPIDKIDPAEPMLRIEPVEPIDKMDPLDPKLRSEPAEPADRGELRRIPMMEFSHPLLSARGGRRAGWPRLRPLRW